MGCFFFLFLFGFTITHTGVPNDQDRQQIPLTGRYEFRVQVNLIFFVNFTVKPWKAKWKTYNSGLGKWEFHTWQTHPRVLNNTQRNVPMPPLSSNIAIYQDPMSTRWWCQQWLILPKELLVTASFWNVG